MGSPHGRRLREIWLFGSRAKGTSSPDSDYFQPPHGKTDWALGPFFDLHCKWELALRRIVGMRFDLQPTPAPQGMNRFAAPARLWELPTSYPRPVERSHFHHVSGVVGVVGGSVSRSACDYHLSHCCRRSSTCALKSPNLSSAGASFVRSSASDCASSRVALGVASAAA
jgi:hypothetical protein